MADPRGGVAAAVGIPQKTEENAGRESEGGRGKLTRGGKGRTGVRRAAGSATDGYISPMRLRAKGMTQAGDCCRASRSRMYSM